jgi:hypothetical protein
MDKIYLKLSLQKILDSNFTNVEKRKIHDFHDRYNFACPYCRDSNNIYKKRGNLYLNKLLYICFNCDKKTSFDKFCKDFNYQIDPDKKLEIIEHLNNNVSYSDYEDDFIDAKFDKLLDLGKLTELFNTYETTLSDFKPVEKDSEVYKYLVNRCISPNMHQNIYQAKYWHNEEWSEPVIVLLNKRGDKVLGAQVRNLKDGKKRLFKIYNYETLFKWLNGENADYDITEMVIYNKLSYFFNILNVDFSHTVTIFEGYIDSLFYPNSIGVVGVNTDVKFLETNNLEIQYFYDNDIAGYKKSEKKIKDGFKVFLWNKLFENVVDNKKSDDPYKLLNRINKVKDLNKLAEFANNPYSKLKLSNFFSEDIYDIKYLPKIKYTKASR